jgi:hypothetical protein
MRNTLNPKDPFHLTDSEIDQLCIVTGTYSEDASEEIKQEWRDIYRKVEEETNTQIATAGSVEKWYESGIGRIL